MGRIGRAILLHEALIHAVCTDREIRKYEILGSLQIFPTTMGVSQSKSEDEKIFENAPTCSSRVRPLPLVYFLRIGQLSQGVVDRLSESLDSKEVPPARQSLLDERVQRRIDGELAKLKDEEGRHSAADSECPRAGESRQGRRGGTDRRRQSSQQPQPPKRPSTTSGAR